MKKMLLLILFFISQIVYSDTDSNTIVIDLGKDEPYKTFVRRTSLEKVEFIKIVNKFNVNYTVDITKETEIQAFPSIKMEASDADKNADRQAGGECKKLVNLFELIEKMQVEVGDDANTKKWMEKDLYYLIEKLRKTMKKIEENNIQCKSKSEATEILEESVRKHPVNVELKKDEQLVIIIKRNKVKWKYLVTRHSAPRGKWYTSYGFSFISPGINKSDNFFVKKIDSNGSDGFVIAKKDSSDNKNWLDMDYVPSIFFWWMPTKRMSNPWRIGFTGGLGVDLKAPSVFAGIGFIYRYNIGINVGVALHRQYRLKDKYHENMPVNEILEFDDLHRSVYRPNLFLSVTFRFGSSPFAPAKAEESTKNNKPKENEKPEENKKPKAGNK